MAMAGQTQSPMCVRAVVCRVRLRQPSPLGVDESEGADVIAGQLRARSVGVGRNPARAGEDLVKLVQVVFGALRAAVARDLSPARPFADRGLADARRQGGEFGRHGPPFVFRHHAPPPCRPAFIAVCVRPDSSSHSPGGTVWPVSQATWEKAMPPAPDNTARSGAVQPGWQHIPKDT